jgi:ELWxxDGT repeat protein
VDSSYPRSLTVAGDWLYFTALTNIPGVDLKSLGLWKTDGTAAGTSRVQTASGLNLANNITILGAVSNLLFVKDYWSTLWRTDGTPIGTFSLNGITDSYVYENNAVTFGGRLYYHGCEPGGDIHSLMATDGSVSGTTVVKPITPGPMAAAESRLVFAGDDGYAGVELWSTDGTSEGTYLVKDINTATPTRQPAAIIPAGKRVFMISDDTRYNPEDPYYNNNPYYRLWISDGTQQGTRLAPNPAVCHEPYYVPHFYAIVGNALYYPGGDCDIWRTDGTAEGTYAVQNGLYNGVDSLSSVTAVIGERLYVFADGNFTTSDQDLWVIDGSPAKMRLCRAPWFIRARYISSPLLKMITRPTACAFDGNYGKATVRLRAPR